MKPVRQWLARKSLTGKLRLANLVTSGSVILLSSLFLLGLQAWLSFHALLDRTRTDAAMTSANLAVSVLFQDRGSASAILAFLRASRAIKAATVYDLEGQVFATYRRDVDDFDAYPQPADRHPGYHVSASRIGWYQPFHYEGQQLGHILVVGDMNTVYAGLLSYVGMILLLLAASLALASMVLNRLQGVIAEPLRQLAGAARDISQRGDFSIRAPAENDGDIGRLAATFNNILDRIQHRETELTAEINERERVQQQLDYLAHFDNVTGLHNRHYFHDRLEHAVAQARGDGGRTALIFIDLDNFKTFNDTLGHATGDEVLRIVARRVAHTVRSGDVLARVGGDEFAIVVRDVPEVSLAEKVAQKFLDALTAPIIVNGAEIFVSASIGISVCPDDAVDGRDLLKYADAAMYYAKNSGKNAFAVFAPSMRGAVERRFQMEGAMRRALERDELQLLYQPKVELATGRVIGAEALVRWQSPELGWLPPQEFIPLAEETGMIVAIGEWVLRTACAQLQQWHTSGHRGLQMAVNLSGRQLREPGFIDLVARAVGDTGIDPCCLELELTESMLMDAGNHTLSKLRALRASGISLAIDDFGTGYSSMNYLKLFPVDTLKIDKSFVLGLPGNSEDCAIVQAILAMASNLRLKVVAEGIEEEAQSAFLYRNGCERAQGLLYGHPMTSTEFQAMLARVSVPWL